ncbi:hypothetical protein JCM14076_10760 [Methylosoma difficile]
MAEAENVNEQFLHRADAHIALANEQLKTVARESVCASFMFGVARFNIWTHACDMQSSEKLAATRNEAIAFFADQYRAMLEQHMEDYVINFDKYMNGESTGE